MRFSVDAHAIGQHLTGNEVYIRNLLEGMARLDASAEIIAYVSGRGVEAQLPRRVVHKGISKNPFVRLGWELGLRLRQDRPDLLHVQYTAPLACPVPVVVSVHDVSFLEHPEFFAPARAMQLRTTVRRTVEQAARVLTPSEFSRRAILRHYRVDEEKVVVVPNAASARFSPMNREHAFDRAAARFSIGGPFLLAVGDLQPRKNQLGLVRAFEALLERHPELPHWLVLAGKETWHGSEVHRAAERSPAARRIRFTGYVSDEDLRLLYNACQVFVFPSFYEGFGIPILEAMACGCAVACSNSTAMPEVADAAAILFDPRSTSAMRRAIEDLTLDSALRARMERLGLQRAAQFSWDAAARRTLEVYYGVAGEQRVAGRERARAATAVRP